MAGDGVRCPVCRAVGPEFARWCPSCGAALGGELLVIEPSAWDDEPEPPAPASPPTSTGRRRRLTAGAVVALGVAVIAAASAGGGDEAAAPTTTTTTTTAARRPATTEGTRFTRSPESTSSTSSTSSTALAPDALPESTDGVRLVLLRRGRVEVVDLDARTVASHDVPELNPQGGDVEALQYATPPAFVRTGEHLVFRGGDAVWAVPLDFSTPAVRLGEAERFLTRGRDRVWLVRLVPPAPPTVQEVDVRGRPVRPPVALPADWTPTLALDAALVLHRGDRFLVWDPATGRTLFESGAGASAIAAGGSVVAWRYFCDGPFCALHLLDVTTGRERLAHLGEAYFGPATATFSPDGRTLATVVVRNDGRVQRQVLAFVDVASGEVELAGEAGLGEPVMPVWSASGRWLFMARPGDVVAYRRGLAVGHELELHRRSDAPLVAW